MAATNLAQRVARVLVRDKASGETAMVHGAQLVQGYQRALPRRGTRELLQAYSASPILQAVVRKISSSMAAVRWVAKIKTPTGDEVEVPNHIAEKMINGGVPGLDGVQCRMLENTFMELVGESFALIDRNIIGAPQTRWPLPPHWITNIPQPSEDIFTVQPPGGSPFTVQRRNMLWHKDADPFNPYHRGVGIARSLSDELNADEAAAKHTAASLTNRARPDLIISGSKEVALQKEDALRLSEVWSQRFGGPENQGKPFFSASPITVETLTPTFRELELSKIREFERDIVVTVFGVPPGIMGIMQDVNRAAIDAADEHYAKHVLKPRLDARKAVYNEQLAPQYDDRLIIDYEDPVEENREFKQLVVASRPAAFTDDEVRELANMAPLPDGEGETRPSIAAPVVPLGLPAPDKRAKAVTKISQRDIDAIIDAVNEELTATILRANARSSVAEFASDALDDINASIAFDIESPATVEFIANSAGERSHLIHGTTQDALRSTLSEGVKNGENGRDLIRRVLDAVEDATAARADMIARTETTRAAGFAVNEAFEQAGIEQREWLAVQGTPQPPALGATRDTHRERTPTGLDGQVRSVGEAFTSSSGATAMFPGDFGVADEDINCRCVVIAVDSLPDAKSREAKWTMKASQMERVEAGLARQLRSMFREQGQAVVAVIERKDNA